MRLGRCVYLRHGALVAGETDTGGYFCGMSREVHIKGDYGNLRRFLRPLFARKLRDMTMLIAEYDALNTRMIKVK